MWDKRFLELAAHIAGWSKDPSTKVGAVIVRPNKTIASVGFNGFPRGIEDTPSRLENREEKYPRIVHAELNAILNCPERPEGYTLYATLAPCAQCTAAIIQSGIRRICTYIETNERWAQQQAIASEMCKEAGIQIYYLDTGGTIVRVSGHLNLGP